MIGKKMRIVGVLFILASSAMAKESMVPEITVPLMRKAPKIDGVIDKTEWSGAARMERFCKLSPEAFPGKAAFWVGCDGKTLFIAIKCVVGPNGILQRVAPKKNGNAMSYLDDSVEIVVIPDMNVEKKKIHHSIINNRGAVYSRSKIAGKVIPWHGDWKVKGTVKNGYWNLELALPLEELGIEKGVIPKTMGVRVCRNWKRLALGQTQSSWSPVKCAFFSTNAIPLAHWDSSAPVTQVTQMVDKDDPSHFNIKLAVSNPGNTEISAKVMIKVKPVNSANIETIKQLTIKAKETITVSCKGAALNGEKLATSISVTSTDGAKKYYTRYLTWSLGGGEDLFAKDQSDSERVSAKFAYYPSYDKMRLKVDLAQLKSKKKIDKVIVSIKDSKGAKLAETLLLIGKTGVGSMIWSVPDLKKHTLSVGDSGYEVVFKVPGVEKPVVRKFVRNVMPWEGNKLGKSDTIVPPFTPIEVNGMTVKTLLRSHELNKLGLWRQVVAAEEKILKKNGMRLEAVVDGKKTELLVEDFKFIATTPAKVSTLSKFTVGGTRGTALGEWDYDGMMKWTLTLKPGADLDSLKLLIPIDDAKAPLFHTCTDGIRINNAGYTPKGTGKIWNGSMCAKNSIIGTYVPYIWLGGELRGISVFGENDKGWVNDEKTPCQEIVRSNGTLHLSLNLISKRVTSNAERKIVIGFQATPIKPMPKNWRKWNSWNWVGRGMIKQFDFNLHFFGSCWYYGTVTSCADIYPRDKDLTFWRKLAKIRRSGKTDKEFITQWMKGYRINGKPGSKQYERRKKTYFAHVRAGLHNAKVSGVRRESDAVIFYTNARGVRTGTPEGATFVDEWLRMPFIKRKFNYFSAVAYDLNPNESYRDYAMWWYNKMFDTGANDLLYWDDIFLQSNFNLVGSDAYQLPDGSIQPAAGLFDMRELVKRSAVLMAEKGMRVRNMVHMTNTGIAPICSFAQMNYEWEDNNGHADFQDRHTRAYTRTITTGRQFGNFTVALAPVSGGTKEQLAWCARTAAGVMITHELRWSANWKEYWTPLKKLYDFGYGNSDVKVFNYWNAGYPCEIRGIESSSIVLSKKGETLIVVCDYGNGGDVELKLDIAKLALPEKFTAIDIETEKPLAVAENTVKLKLKKHDYKMILLSKK